jgi:hypothetical protein
MQNTLSGDEGNESTTRRSSTVDSGGENEKAATLPEVSEAQSQHSWASSPSQSLDELKADYRIRYDKLRWLSWFDIESAIEAAARIGRKKGRNEILKQLPSSTRLRITPPKP